MSNLYYEMLERESQKECMEENKTILKESYIKRLVLKDCPIEPIEDGYLDIPMVCPRCGEDIRRMIHKGNFPHYCCCCGQALKEKV